MFLVSHVFPAQARLSPWGSFLKNLAQDVRITGDLCPSLGHVARLGYGQRMCGPR